ncbi:MAG: polyprenyl synthetase family protein [Candidatus Nanopelagicales bacterium]|jgi:heptaprenyl diphosphate synthase
MTESPLGELSVDAALDASLSRSLAEVETELRAAVVSNYPFVTEASQHLVDAGGKRFRPLLTLLASHLGADPTNPDVVKAAVVVELTHLATLYHDDVMDEAELRRGAPSANARWNNTVAILTGDFLFARASDILADLGPEAVRIQAQTFERLCTGQIRESVGPDDGVDPVKHHLHVLADKTGSLIATAGRFGTMMAGADPETIDIMTRFGEAIGVAFQLADDIVDITSESSQSGKLPGTDLREGVPTLTALLVRTAEDPADSELVEFLSGPIADDAQHARALELLRAHTALDQAREEACRWAGDARRTLRPLPDSPARQALEALCDYVVNRTG